MVKKKVDIDNYLRNLQFDQEEYHQYALMTEYQKKTLVGTNYWRVITGETEIPVPPQDKHYAKYFDKRCYDLIGKINSSTFKTNISVLKTKKIETNIEKSTITPIQQPQKTTTTKNKRKKNSKEGENKGLF